MFFSVLVRVFLKVMLNEGLGLVRERGGEREGQDLSCSVTLQRAGRSVRLVSSALYCPW